MCKYTVKHYWDDDTSEATIEPEWITSAKDLSAEEQEVKKLANKLLSATNYNHLSRDKPKSETIDGFELTYTYRDKKDPHPSRKRMVTDITICMTKKVNYLPYIFIGIVALLLFGFMVLKNGDESKNEIKIEVVEQQQPQEIKSIKIDKIITKQEKQKVIKKVVSSPICKNDEINTHSSDKCYEIYIDRRCKNKTSASYDKWFSTDKWLSLKSPSACTGTGVGKFSDDEDLKTFMKSLKSRKIKQSFKKFMQGK